MMMGFFDGQALIISRASDLTYIYWESTQGQLIVFEVLLDFHT